MADSDASKHALAVKLAELQQKTDGPVIADQLTASAVQPLVVGWSQRINQSVPQARQQEVRDKLDVELKKFTESTQKAINAQLGKAAETGLVPIFMEKLSEKEMKTIITYMESPASAKFHALGPDAANAWAQGVIDATKTSVENNAKSFEDAANNIVSAAGGSAPAPAPLPDASAPAK